MDHPSTTQFSGAVARNTEQKVQKVAVHCAPPIDLINHDQCEQRTLYSRSGPDRDRTGVLGIGMQAYSLHTN